MNLNKHLEFFNPNELTEEVHIIGCGAIGSTVAEMLTRLGVNELYLYDFDKVSEHNITNQMFRQADVGELKVTALAKQLQEINPDIKLHLEPQGYTELTRLRGIVFLAVDSIELRKEIVTTLKYNKDIVYVTDCRMGLTDAQCYAASWDNEKQIDSLLQTMQFTSEEAKEATPISACGTTLSVTPTVRMIVSLCVSNFINFIKNKEVKTMIIVDAFAMNITYFPI
jgi:adenylyltransferase/sulfurtransferase